MKAFLYPTRSSEWAQSANVHDNAVAIIEDNGTIDGGKTLVLLPIDIDRLTIERVAIALGICELDQREWP